ncbi:MAG TPA: Wzz/FepE/Etk N-terminal domain-containing protein [Candidatus Atribacteria bacterium]|nr:Wzz/FepE/Etk N-terminal domain-containing protein [Candidatus Atribacteria bacterium]
MELELRNIVEIILKRIWIIVAITLAAAIVGLTISVFFIDDVYSASTTLIVREKRKSGEEYQLSDLNLARNLVDTYSVIIKSNRVLEKVLDEVGSDITTNELRSKISVQSEGNTEIIRITVEDLSPETAKNIANSTARVFMNEIVRLLEMDNVQVIDEARASFTPVKPKVGMNTAISFILGLMVSLGLAFVLEYFDNTIKEPEDVEKYLDLPVIGVIPIIE